MKINCEVDLLSGHTVHLSHVSGLIILNTATINAQWQISNTAIELKKTANVLKIGFHSHDSLTYQSWLFDVNSEAELNNFFTTLGYKSMTYDLVDGDGEVIQQTQLCEPHF